MLYHYTTIDAARSILRDGAVKPGYQELHRDMAMRGETLVVGPLIWLSINPLIEPTVVVKMKLKDIPLIGGLARVVVSDDCAPEGLGEYTDRVGIDCDWWRCVVITGHLAGSNYTTWRIREREIPRAEWARVEVLTGIETWIERERVITTWEKISE